MLENTKLRRAIRLAITVGMSAHVGSTLAQDAANGTEPQSQEVEVIVVTGSHIAGTPQDAALPVDVVSADELADRGAPTIVQLVKTITSSGSSMGESNRYNVGAGTASINLRGFGQARTLVLMNSRRLAINPAAGAAAGANLNFIPQAALARVEILRDGAAATYGSEAIGGVVNFITRTDLDGLVLDAQYAQISGSDGDYQASMAWGSRTEGGNTLLTVGYRHRSRLDIHERDWALGPYEDPNYGGWTGATNPGFYTTNGTPRVTFRDNGCNEMGGVFTDAAGRPATTPLASSVCRFQFSNFNDVVNEEDHYQVHGEFNAALGEDRKVHAEATFARDDVPMQRLSPSNLNTQFPTPTSLGGTSGSLATPFGLNLSVPYNVPAANPGLVDLYTVCAAPLTPAQCSAMRTSAAGVDISQTAFRTIAFAGHPVNADKADHQRVRTDEFRFVVGVNGALGSVDWDTAATYMRAQTTNSLSDLVVDRIQLALNGYGSRFGASDQCTQVERTQANAGNAAVGCYFFNPFTNSVAVSAVNGLANPYHRGGVDPRVANDPALIEWLYGHYENVATNQLFAFDAVASGALPWSLPGGEIGWALGGQYRWNETKAEFGDLFNNEVTPCVDSVDDGTPGCGNPNGPLIFVGSNSNSLFTQDVAAVFGEMRLPLLDALEATVAVRFEDYGGGIGSTTDPKLSLRWQVIDWLALRGSAGTTFRAPPAAAVVAGCTTGVANINGQYRALENCGNPALAPETADAYNVGVLLDVGTLRVSVDYFLFKFQDELTLESPSRLFATMWPAPATDPVGHCNDAALAPLRDRFTFAGACSANTVLRIHTNNINGPATESSGLDMRVDYTWGRLWGGSLATGVDGTYLLQYDRGEFVLNGTDIVFAPPESRDGKSDLVAQFFSYPRFKGNGYLSFSRGTLTARWQTLFVKGTRPAFGTPANRWVQDAGGAYVQQPLGTSDDFWQHDLIVRYELAWETTVTATIQNLFDADPPHAPGQYNYDYTNGNPLGRVFQLAIRKRF